MTEQEPRGDWTVRTRIVRHGPDDISVDCRLRETDGTWKIIDVTIEGLSLAANYRSQFHDVTVGERLYYLAEENYGVLAVGHTFGTLNDGGAFESVFVQIGLYGANGLRSAELFELEDLDRARARFEELRPDPLSIPPNAATRPSRVPSSRS